MLRNQGWNVTDVLARQQWQLYRSVGEEVQFSEEDRRRALLLSEQEWAAWTDFLERGDLPPQPPLPEMLQRLGTATWRLAALAERQRPRVGA